MPAGYGVDGMRVSCMTYKEMNDPRVAFLHTTDFALFLTEVHVASIPFTLMIFEYIIPKTLLFIM